MNNQQQQFQQNTGTGLTRYRSAPSSYFASFLDSPTAGDGGGGFGVDDLEQLFNPRASSPESQRIFSRFLSGSDVGQGNLSANLPIPPPQQLNSQFPLPKNEPQQGNEYAPPSQMIYQSRNSEENSFDKVSWGSFNSNTAPPVKMGRGGGGGGGSTLIRHSSSPAGLFANINIENEFGAMGSFGGGNGNNAETSSFSSGSRMNNAQMDSFPSKHSVSGMMDPISEIGENNPLNNDGGFSMNSWDDSSMLPDNFLNGLPDNDARTFPNAAAPDEQNNEPVNRPTTLLSHHMSLPSNSAELEKLLQDSVPCKIRAKRGCATHPRSIAERVRRTKISERMRKLQELVPNMEKQTNTSDMLDLAVDYIKDLQKQVKKLNDNRENCSCSAAKQRS